MDVVILWISRCMYYYLAAGLWIMHRAPPAFHELQDKVVAKGVRSEMRREELGPLFKREFVSRSEVASTGTLTHHRISGKRQDGDQPQSTREVILVGSVPSLCKL